MNYHVNIEKVKYKSDGGTGQLRTVSKLARNTYKSTLNPRDFVSDLRSKVLSLVRNLEIKYYSVGNDCIVDVGLFKEDNYKKAVPQITRHLNVTHGKPEKQGDIRRSFAPELVDVIIEDATADVIEEVSELLENNGITNYNKKFVYQIWDSPEESQRFSDLVISLPGNLAVLAIPLIKDEIIKNKPHFTLVITNEKLRNQISKLIGLPMDIASFAWSSQKCEDVLGAELMNTTFVSDFHKVNVYYDNSMDVISHCLKGKYEDDVYNHAIIRADLPAK